MRRFSGWVVVSVLLLTSCEQQRPVSQAPSAAVVPPDSTYSVVLQPSPVAPPPASDTTDVSRVRFGYRIGHDTTFYSGPQKYRLLLRAETDSTKPLVTTTQGTVGPAFADDTSSFAKTGRVRGYQGHVAITLFDAAGKQVFHRKVRKEELYSVASRDVVTVSELVPPMFVGVHAPSQTLVFSLDIGIPYSDVWQRCVLVLGFNGQVKRLATSYSSNWDAPDCEPRLLPDGTLLTCEALVSPDGRQVSLVKPKAQLLAAFPLTDSTFYLLYRYGQYRPQLSVDTTETLNEFAITAAFNDPAWAEDPHMKNKPNAFIINRRGNVRKTFRYTGVSGAIGFDVPRFYLPQTHTYYFLMESGGLQTIDKHNAHQVTTIPLARLQTFRKPSKPTEARIVLNNYAFYIDTLRPKQVRYQKLPPRYID
ncbi:hypothetical protein [Hymenobacter guriensis]|uniref:DUF4221 domain-containing protein n=1 Tax=Hymenobacter guriensis TaxID=2793065 RepID=A0ABS0L880_9BACT|nr:hypothetical protein [Hymenobacter guriensis]MBG8556360.1 hypothetical protein [Hymenobacter guriensis]